MGTSISLCRGIFIFLQGQNLPLYQNAVGNHPDRLNNVYLSYMLLYRAVCRLAEKIDELPFGDLESKEAFYIKVFFQIYK